MNYGARWALKGVCFDLFCKSSTALAAPLERAGQQEMNVMKELLLYAIVYFIYLFIIHKAYTPRPVRTIFSRKYFCPPGPVLPLPPLAKGK